MAEGEQEIQKVTSLEDWNQDESKLITEAAYPPSRNMNWSMPPMRDDGMLSEVFVEFIKNAYPANEEYQAIIARGTENGEVGVQVNADNALSEAEVVNYYLALVNGEPAIAPSVVNEASQEGAAPTQQEAPAPELAAAETVPVRGKGDLTPDDIKLIFSAIEFLPNEKGFANIPIPTAGTLRRSDVLNRDDLSFTTEFVNAFESNKSDFSADASGRVQALIDRMGSKEAVEGETLGLNQIAALHAVSQNYPEDSLVTKNGVITEDFNIYVGRVSPSDESQNIVSSLSKARQPQATPSAETTPEPAVQQATTTKPPELAKAAGTYEDPVELTPMDAAELETLRARTGGEPVEQVEATAAQASTAEQQVEDAIYNDTSMEKAPAAATAEPIIPEGGVPVSLEGLEQGVDGGLPEVEIMDSAIQRGEVGDDKSSAVSPEVTDQIRKAVEEVVDGDIIQSTLSEPSTGLPPIFTSGLPVLGQTPTVPPMAHANPEVTIPLAPLPTEDPAQAAERAETQADIADEVAAAKKGPNISPEQMGVIFKTARHMQKVQEPDSWITEQLEKVFGDEEKEVSNPFDGRIFNDDWSIAQSFIDSAKEYGVVDGLPQAPERPGQPAAEQAENILTLSMVAADIGVKPTTDVTVNYDQVDRLDHMGMVNNSTDKENLLIIENGVFSEEFKSVTVDSEYHNTIKEVEGILQQAHEAKQETVIAGRDEREQTDSFSIYGLISDANAAGMPVQQDTQQEQNFKGYTVDDLDVLRQYQKAVPLSSEDPAVFNSFDATLLRDAARDFNGVYVLGANGKPTEAFMEHAEGLGHYGTESNIEGISRRSIKSVVEALNAGTIFIPGQEPQAAVGAQADAPAQNEPTKQEAAPNKKPHYVPSPNEATPILMPRGSVTGLAEGAGLEPSDWSEVKPFLEAMARLNNRSVESLDHVREGEELFFPNKVGDKVFDYEKHDIVRAAVLRNPTSTQHDTNRNAEPIEVVGDVALTINKGDTLYEVVRDLAKANGVEDTSFGALKDEIQGLVDKSDTISDMGKVNAGDVVDIPSDIFGEEKNLSIPQELQDNMVPKR